MPAGHPVPGVLERACALLVVAAILAYSSGYAGWVMLGLLLVTLAAVVTRTYRWIPTTIDRPLAVLVIVALLSGLTSEWRWESTGIAMLFAVAVWMTVFTTAVAARRWPAALGLLVGTWITGALFAAAWGIARTGPLPDRLSTPALSPTALGTTLAVAVVLTLGVGSVVRTYWQRFAIALALALLVPALALTWSRGAMLAATAGWVVLIAVAPRARASKAIMLAAAIAIGALVVGPGSSPLAGRLASIISVEDNLDRWALWMAVPKMVRDRPLLGTGYGTFTHAWPRYRADPSLGEKPTAHNVYLNFAAETGLVGAAAFLAFTGAGLAGLWRRAVRSRGDGQTDGLWAALFAAAVTVLVHQLFDATIMSWHVGYGLIVLFTLGAVREP